MSEWILLRCRLLVNRFHVRSTDKASVFRIDNELAKVNLSKISNIDNYVDVTLKQHFDYTYWE